MLLHPIGVEFPHVENMLKTARTSSSEHNTNEIIQKVLCFKKFAAVNILVRFGKEKLIF